MAIQYLKLEHENAPKEELEKLTLGGLRKAVFDGDVKHGSVMMGQVAAAYRGQQYAHLLMDVMIATANQEQCETISLEVRVSNEAAHKLYEHYDFIKVNVRKAYYQDNGEDADFLIKALGGNCI